MVGRRVSNKDTIAMFVILKILISLAFFACWVQGKETIDFDAQLKLINKPALKSFRTEYGDIIDCIDIYKQLAFDHPLLKNHKIQMKPKTTPKQIGGDGASKVNKSLNYMPTNIVCPAGSVPIKRATREDLMMAESMKSSGRNHPANNLSRQESNSGIQGHEFASLIYQRRSYGSTALLNVWRPVVQEQQFSLGGMGFTNGPTDVINTIEAGWLAHGSVNPGASRLFIFWAGDGYKTGCYNTLCPGFVQVSPDITPGIVLQPSTFGGPQSQMYYGLHQDRATWNWWLMVSDKYIGYWPKELLPQMSNGAVVWWGGEVYSPVSMFSPTMGSGHFPQEGYAKSAYIDQLKVISDGTQYEDPVEQSLYLFVNTPNCYNAMHSVTHSKPYTRFMFFGGPGNCTF